MHAPPCVAHSGQCSWCMDKDVAGSSLPNWSPPVCTNREPPTEQISVHAWPLAAAIAEDIDGASAANRSATKAIQVAAWRVNRRIFIAKL